LRSPDNQLAGHLRILVGPLAELSRWLCSVITHLGFCVKSGFNDKYAQF
jgi:hypothetical protein